MKIKYNLQKLKEIKNKVIEKIKKNKEKIALKYYVMFFLMFFLLITFTTSNVKKYLNIGKENYDTYSLQEEEKEDSIEYKTAVSSISTNISNIQEVVEVVGSNIEVSNKQVSKMEAKYIFSYSKPLTGEIIKEYAMDKVIYSKTLDMWRTHPGIDISSKVGTEVRAIEKGKVVDIYKNAFYGYTVEIEHEEGYISLYANLDENVLVKRGDNVKKSKVIGKVGTSAAGENKDETHLHFEILKNGENVDPGTIIFN